MVLSKAQEDLITPTIQKIVDKIKPEIIICYGSRTTTLIESGIFVMENGSREREFHTFDLLIITSDELKPEHINIVETAEKEAISPIKVHCMTHKIGYVNGAVRNSVRFFCSVILKGRVLFDRGEKKLIECENIPEQDLAVTWEWWYDLAQKYLGLADHAFGNGWYKQTAFLAHQVVESTCIGLLQVFTGYRARSHNIRRLLKLTQTFSVLPGTIFPSVTCEERTILSLLTNAYLDTRYKTGYEISKADTAVVLDRAKLFISRGDDLYRLQTSNNLVVEPLAEQFELLKEARF
ncbi:HEPN domain-containing protein [Puia sp. P3]|uniref:HEPN domain-containing protein n=1 Tax=Puia sp. P3 TaxID=3423952 RepID=UPI003D66E35F